MFDLVTIGDSAVDTFVTLLQAKTDIIEGGRKLLLNFGDKVPVEPPVSSVGGNAANSAVAASKLHLKTAIYTNIGNFGEDKDDDRIKNKLKKEGVDIRYIVETDEFPSNHHIILSFKGERTILTYHQPWRYELPDFEQSKWVYYTSLSSNFTQTSLVPQLISYLERTGAKLLYNPGTFQIKHGVKKYPRLLSLTELFICNMEEAKIILSFDEGKKVAVKKLLKSLIDLGPKMAVITDGEVGSYGFDGADYFHLGIFPAKEVDMTGCGDAYASGTLAGLFHGKSLDEAMRWGAANGAAAVEQVGAQAGLLSYSQMEDTLKQHSKIAAKEL